MLSLNVEEPAHEVNTFLDEVGGLDFPVLLDTFGLSYEDYYIDAPEEYAPFPRQYVIDEDGIVQYLAAQYYPDALNETIERLLTD